VIAVSRIGVEPASWNVCCELYHSGAMMAGRAPANLFEEMPYASVGCFHVFSLNDRWGGRLTYREMGSNTVNTNQGIVGSLEAIVAREVSYYLCSSKRIRYKSAEGGNIYQINVRFLWLMLRGGPNLAGVLEGCSTIIYYAEHSIHHIWRTPFRYTGPT